MTAEIWEEVERLFHLALALPPASRAAYLASASGDAEVMREVALLLEAEARAASSSDWNAAGIAADWVEQHRGDNFIGKTFDGYTVLSLLGVGGMGETYLAEEAALGRRVALKFLPVSRLMGGDELRARRFLDEARAASSLNHPGIITVFGIGEVEQQRYIATEYIDGETLRHRLSSGPLPVDRALDIAGQVLGALAAAHAAGIVHRDIKPENIMLRRDGLVKIIDFGLAKLASPSSPGRPALTRTGAVLGTLDYMAPEQASGAADARSDLYSLGVVLFEMLTGELPREMGSGSHGSRGTHARGNRSGLKRLPPGLHRIIRKSVATDPARRWQNAAECRLALEALRPRLRRAPFWRGAMIASACAFLIALATMSFFIVRRWRSAAAPASAGTSLLVMPLEALGSPDAAHLEDGMSNAIITRLSGIPALRVPPAAAIRSHEDPFDAARRLGVAEVLTGTVQRQGRRLRVTAQLSRVSDGGEIWAQQFDQNFTDIFTIQDTIAQKVAQSLLTQLAPADRSRLTRHEATNTDAYDLYLRARDQWALRSPVSIQTAIAMYRQAIAIEPNFALAYAGLADCYNLAASGMAPLRREPLARAAAERAIALDPSSAEAHTALAFLDYKFDWNWRGADAEFHRAIALDPNDALAHHWYGEMLHLEMRHTEALRQFQLAVALDPYSLPVRFDDVHALLNAGRVADARAMVESMRPLGPDSYSVLEADGEVLLAEGHVAGAVSQFIRTRQGPGTNVTVLNNLRSGFANGGLAGYYRAQLPVLLAAARG
ncbi:MAG TPA: protein kinase, partial [Terriglobales bacterium]